MLEKVDKQFFAEKATAKMLHNIERYFTAYEDSGHIITCDCKYVKPQGISYIIYHPSQPSNHYLSFEELDRHTVSLQQFKKLNEKAKKGCKVLAIVTIKETGNGTVSIDDFSKKMAQRNNLLRVIYKNDEPVFTEGIIIRSHTRFVILKEF